MKTAAVHRFECVRSYMQVHRRGCFSGSEVQGPRAHTLKALRCDVEPTGCASHVGQILQWQWWAPFPAKRVCVNTAVDDKLRVFCHD